MLGLLVGLFAAASLSRAQSRPVEWRRIGNAAVEVSLASLATGPVASVWYSPDGARLFALTNTGKLFATSDFETWKVAGADAAQPPPVDSVAVADGPESALKVRRQGGRLYAIGEYAYRSDDGGGNWTNLTRYQGSSLLGAGLLDLAVSPQNPDEVIVAARTGVWRSVDGGLSWSGLNESLPNLPVDRILSLPAGRRGLRIDAGNFSELEWIPGEKQAWRPDGNAEVTREAELRRALAQALRATVTAVAASGDTVYAGASDGRVWVSPDSGKSWLDFRLPDSGPVERFWVDAKDPRIALAALGARPPSAAPGSRAPQVIRTLNAGAFWDDLSANLPDAAAHGVAADRASGALYVATDAGIFTSSADLTALAPPGPWSLVSGNLPTAPAMDVRLDLEGNRLYAALAGFGVYEAIAPHRSRDPRVVSAADYRARSAAPGALLSVLGAKIEAAHAGDVTVPVLAASGAESQIQIPFEARGNSVALALDESAGVRITVPVQLETVAPAIFVDHDGAPLLVDADSGMLLDAAAPAHAGSLIQVLATGLGRVNPDWPTGLAAPLEHPPAVAAQVNAVLGGQPVVVTRAVLAPGYIGFDLVEVQLPKIVDYGSVELYLQVDGHESNRVQIYIEP
ncbi:MAG: hypothetical protein ABI165_18210 [Bryobacteraceae bacterium]